MLRVRLAIAIFLMGLGSAHALDVRAPVLLPAHGIYGLPAKSGGTLVNPLPSHISPDFISAIGYDSGPPIDEIGWFRAEMVRLFSSAVVDSVTPQNKYRTYAVSLQITRADEYSVNKPDGNVDIYLPVAVNVYFTNILTGEVLYSSSRTGYFNLTETQVNYSAGKSKSRIEQAYRENLRGLTTAILTQASVEFKPLHISANVTDEWNGYSIINKGIDAGIAVGNELVNQDGSGLKIIQSGKTYAVGVPTLGVVHKGDELSFFSTAAANDVRKPRVLILDADTPADFPGAYASTQFSENIGGKSSFSILPVNPDFQAVLNDVSENQGLKQEEVTQHRVLPGYFLRLKVLPPVEYELPSNHEFGKVREFEGTAFAELIDASGRVVYATSAEERLDDQVISGGMAFDIKDRNKILYGNLLDTLSKKFIKDVRFSNSELSLKDVSPDKVVVSDHAGLLALGANVRIYHKLDSVKGIADAVMVPVWDAQVSERNASDVVLSLVLPTIQSSRPLPLDAMKDSVIVEGSGTSTVSRLAFSMCDVSRDIGGIHLPALNDVAYFSLGSSFKQPFFSGNYIVGGGNRSLPDAVADLSHAGFSKPVSVLTTATPLCLEPLLKITETDRKCTSEGVCDIALSILAGIQVLHGDVKGPKKALSVDVKIGNAPQDGLDAFEARRALLKVIELMSQAVAQIDTNGL